MSISEGMGVMSLLTGNLYAFSNRPT